MKEDIIEAFKDFKLDEWTTDIYPPAKSYSRPRCCKCRCHALELYKMAYRNYYKCDNCGNEIDV